MDRKKAESLIGTRVNAWTSANGVYVGTLEEVVPRRPWRGKVRITGIVSPAQAFEVGRNWPRKGFRPGDVIEVGGVNIKPTDEVGVSYIESLKNDLAKLVRLREGAGPRDFWHLDKAIDARREQIAKIEAEEAVLV